VGDKGLKPLVYGNWGEESASLASNEFGTLGLDGPLQIRENRLDGWMFDPAVFDV
jgi:hypothetical protein